MSRILFLILERAGGHKTTSGLFVSSSPAVCQALCWQQEELPWVCSEQVPVTFNYTEKQTLCALILSLGNIKIEFPAPGLTSGLWSLMLFVDERRLNLPLCFFQGDVQACLLKKLQDLNCTPGLTPAFLFSTDLGWARVPNLSTQGD